MLDTPAKPWAVSNPKPLASGILTKPDLVDKGTEEQVVDVVRNLICHLKKGYMIVKCRGQQDIQDRLSLAEALRKEKAFFEENPYFRYARLCGPEGKPKPGTSVLTEEGVQEQVFPLKA